MRLWSISGAHSLSFQEAILSTGYAPDGTLYTLPNELIPRFSRDAIEALRHLPHLERHIVIAETLLGNEFTLDQLAGIVNRSFPVPVKVRHLWGRHYVAELFHVVTDAFKDYGTAFQAQTTSIVIEIRITMGEFGHEIEIVMLGNTSGDTGGAGAKANHRVPRIKVVITYPRGRVTPFQEYQMGLGDNIYALRTNLDFDDNMALNTRALQDPALSHLTLTTMNSVNIARLIGQVFYYFDAYYDATERAGQEVIFSVPCGNITAGGFAQKMGLPIKRFLAAGNINTPLVRYAETGLYQPLPKSIRTDSNAMDVANPVNWPRLAALHNNSVGVFCANITPFLVTDEQMRETMRQDHYTGYLWDPHGAVAKTAANLYARTVGEDVPIVTLATASPAKFGTVIDRVVGFVPPVVEKDRGWEQKALTIYDLEPPTYEAYRDFILKVVKEKIPA